MADITEIKIVEGKEIIRNLPLLNQNIDMILGRVVDPHLKKFLRSIMQQSGMKKYPGGVVRPIEWETKLQELMWFKTGGFGGGIPSRRTGELFRHFDVTTDRRLAQAAIENDHDAAIYIIGERQQKFHANTGYRKMESYEDEVADGAEPVVARGLESEINKFLFSRGLL
jgi:hypothetical protein